MDILEFTGEHRWLSNFWPADVWLDYVCYPTVENAYQAAKFRPELRAPFKTCSPGEAKRLGRLAVLPPGWDDAKVAIMRYLIEQKFSDHEDDREMAQKLIDTAPGQLVEGNTWNDQFWGVCRGFGKNMLGLILMEHRAHLIYRRWASSQA